MFKLNDFTCLKGKQQKFQITKTVQTVNLSARYLLALYNSVTSDHLCSFEYLIVNVRFFFCLDAKMILATDYTYQIKHDIYTWLIVVIEYLKTKIPSKEKSKASVVNLFAKY